MKTTVIVDLDGTVATTIHRAHILDEKPRDWIKYALACVNDPPIDEMVQLVRHLRKIYNVIFLTGRNEEALEPTREWLARHDLIGVNSEVIMRQRGDLRPNPELKISAVGDLVERGVSIVLAIDDYPAVLEAYRERFGITGLLPVRAGGDPGILTGIAEGLAATGVSANLPAPIVEALAILRDTFARKNNDYAKDTSWRSNFDAIASQMGFSAVAACDTLVAVKQARLQALTANGRDPVNEAVEDTYLDRMVYACIAYALFLDDRASG